VCTKGTEMRDDVDDRRKVQVVDKHKIVEKTKQTYGVGKENTLIRQVRIVGSPGAQRGDRSVRQQSPLQIGISSFNTKLKVGKVEESGQFATVHPFLAWLTKLIKVRVRTGSQWFDSHRWIVLEQLRDEVQCLARSGAPENLVQRHGRHVRYLVLGIVLV